MSHFVNCKEAGFRALGRLLQLPPFGGPRMVVAADRLSFRRRPFPHLVPNGAPRFQILVYHRVLPKRDLFAISPLSAAEFDGQMTLLRNHYRVISLDRLVEELDEGRMEPGTVCVTFDDGYRDNHDYAWPILRKHGIPATIYLATGFTATEERPWYDKVLAAVRDARADRLSWSPAGLAGMDISRSDLRAQAAYRLLEWLKGIAPAERDAHIRDLEAALGFSRRRPPARTMLDWEEVKRMHRQGVAFGAHTVTHPILSTLGEEEMESEIGGSKAAIEAALQSPVRHFAYPNGRAVDYNETARRLVEKLGFSTAVTTIRGVNGPDRSRFELLRRQPWEESRHSFHARLIMERLAA